MARPLISYYGDDFTGSADVMEALASNGVETVLFLEVPDADLLSRFAGARAFGLAGTSRSETPDWMDVHLRAAFGWLETLDAALCHYKVCSTFDSAPHVGNIGRAIEIGRAVFGAATVPLLVGAPQIRRYTAFGELFAAYQGRTYRIDRHPVMARHPVTPMDEANLLRHLSRQTTLSSALVDLVRLQDDPQPEEADMLLIDVLDAATQTAAGTLLWNTLREKCRFVCGSSGLEYALIPTWRREGLIGEKPHFPAAGPVDRIAVVSGSVSPTTERQIRHALENGFAGVTLDPLVLSGEESGSAVASAVEAGLKVLQDGHSVVLYNADAAELPLATVRELSSIQEGGKLQCSVSVRHADQAKLRSVYGELVNKAGDDPDLPVVSETSDNFISKLRIAVTPISSTPGENAQGFKAFDVAFLHDVVARSAKEEWLEVPWTNDRPNLDHAPSRWSYRSVSGEDELKSTTFLTCPWQTASGWAYATAVAAVCNSKDVESDKRFLPARRISLQSQELADLIKDAHNLAEWVATYDELLDKRQLQHNKITVVRYRRGSTNGRNMIVSSTSELRLLGVLVRRRLDELKLPLTPDEVGAAADKAKRDALSVSGDIVLRAAKRGVSAGEMIGLVLSRHLLAEEFKTQAGDGQVLTAYFLLDDYASWLSQPESRIADILAINVEEKDEGIRVVISIVESKYVGADGLAAARRGSKDQLLQTLDKFREALFGDPGRLDRDVWLARLADMLIDAEIPPGMTGLMERARSKLREGEVEISLRGYSHIYVHTSDAGSGSASEQLLLLDESGVKAWQEIFDRDDLRKLVEAYAKDAGSLQARASLGPHEPWSGHSFKKPAPRVQWLGAMGQLANGAVDAAMETATEIPPVPGAPSAQAQESSAPAQSLAQPVVETSASAPPPAVALAANPGSALAELVASKFAGGAQSDAEREAWAQDVTKKLQAALNSYGLQAKAIGTRLTPNGCLVRLAGSDKLRVEDIENKRTQLLTTHAINLVTVQPKPGEIVVTIAGSRRQAVSLWELWSRREFNRNVAGINTSFLLGLQEINGSLLYLNLGAEFGGLSSHEPHSLVAGATGSGKSVLIQALILDIAASNPKDLAQLILIDPKMGVDYAPLADLPHMRDEIVTTKEKAGKVLDALVQEMEDRYRAFAKARARDLPTYNSKVSPEERLPMVFLIHDEFADWMLDDAYKGAVGAAVQRLGVKARAAGIHLIFAAQRPDKDVMPMQLRENLGNRLILKVSSEATSKIALDRPGAELLLGRGHLAAKLNGEQGLVFAQAPFLNDDDIAAAVEAIRTDSNHN